MQLVPIHLGAVNQDMCNFTAVLTLVSGERGLCVHTLDGKHKRLRREASFLLHLLPFPQEYTFTLEGGNHRGPTLFVSLLSFVKYLIQLGNVGKTLPSIKA